MTEKLTKGMSKATNADEFADSNDPLLSTPMPRYNAMLAILKNTLYM